MHLSTCFIQSLLLAGTSFAGTVPHNYKRQETTKKYAVQTPPLDTPWTYKVGTNPWPEYPRPQLERSDWKNLNGIWQYERASSLDAVKTPPVGRPLPQEVLIPSCLESGLSGIQGRNTVYSWFSTKFDVPTDWDGDLVMLNFAAVDYEATVFINGQQAAFHRGGYFQFSVDATKYLNKNGTNELLVFVFDPSDNDDYVIPIGKQTNNPSHIFYTPCSGIWQSVWIERVPENHITSLDLTAGMDGVVNVTVHSSSGKKTPVEVIVCNQGSREALFTHKGCSDESFKFKVNNAKLWSPDSPSLYDVYVRMGEDEVSSYTAFRTVSRGKVNGIERPLLNGEFVYQFGTLDQGYWPDGLHLAPNREAMEFDLKMLKDLGANMVRKHIKLEPALFYKSAAEIGLLVIQDMPSLRASRGPNKEQQDEFVRQLDVMITQFKHHPAIVTWMIFNEGWGQWSGAPEIALTDRVRALDSTRLIDSVSGWTDHGAGDFDDNHHYANPQCGSPFYSLPAGPYDGVRIGFQGEFGGTGHNVSAENLWKVKKAIDEINQTYEINENLEAWNYRGHVLMTELLDQVTKYACSGAVWTQTTDVEGEVNGFVTYDRRIQRTDKKQWQDDIQALYDAAAERSKKQEGKPE